MSADELTAERLDALPDGTVVGWESLGYIRYAVRDDGEWSVVGVDAAYKSEGVLDEVVTWGVPGTLVVVSVPIDALLSDETVEATARAMSDDWNPDRDQVLASMFRDYAQTAIRAAVAQVTGEAL